MRLIPAWCGITTTTLRAPRITTMHISKEKQANNYTCTKITYYRHHSLSARTLSTHIYTLAWLYIFVFFFFFLELLVWFDLLYMARERFKYLCASRIRFSCGMDVSCWRRWWWWRLYTVYIATLGSFSRATWTDNVARSKKHSRALASLFLRSNHLLYGSYNIRISYK